MVKDQMEPEPMNIETRTRGNDSATFAAKRLRNELVLREKENARKEKALAKKAGAPSRTSSLMAPTMCLTGHKNAIYSLKFDPTGNFLASAGFEREIYLWNVYGECENYMVLKGHKNAVQEIHWSKNGLELYSCSADKTVVVWDSETGARVRAWKGHTSYVNSCCPTRLDDSTLVLSGADDGTARIWDTRSKNSVHTQQRKFQVTSVAFSADATQIFLGSLDNNIECYDIRNPSEPKYTLEGHDNTITGLSLSPDGTKLLSNAMDHTLRCWDVKPFCAGGVDGRCKSIMRGHTHNFEKLLLKCSWSPSGDLVSAGSADSFVYVWDFSNTNVLYKLPGHKGSISEVPFHPRESVIASGGSDKSIFLGELQQ